MFFPHRNEIVGVVGSGEGEGFSRGVRLLCIDDGLRIFDERVLF
jgi:hypothetical protein